MKRGFSIIHSTRLATCVLLLARALAQAATPPERPQTILSNATVRAVFDLAGGSLSEFRPHRSPVNPLAWNLPRDEKPQPIGHFLCLDRWGPPSEEEGRRGMPYHGEASTVLWTVESSRQDAGLLEAKMFAQLPLAGFRVERTARLSPDGAVLFVRETVRNENRLGRMYNMVQHPTVAGEFLDESTLVDCNGRRGFAQGGALPNPEEPSSYWPVGLNRDGKPEDLRRLQGDPNPNVVSFVLDGEWGWVTACHPKRGMLLGYLWRSRDYPWVSLWRDARDGKPAARGLEFGTTGLHQPFPVLAQKPRIWERPTFAYLDAGASAERSYAVFLADIPADFQGVENVVWNHERLDIVERTSASPRTLTLNLKGGGYF
ncbi:MAG: hypothetical protein FJ404_08145 [Verrucomicrobia bacterium]|nr:hypothetical protein [Verrucomicrobiota bacterium]